MSAHGPVETGFGRLRTRLLEAPLHEALLQPAERRHGAGQHLGKAEGLRHVVHLRTEQKLHGIGIILARPGLRLGDLRGRR
ncbi:MAG: hypothetical protein P8Y69_16030, partial [Gammaproteobacteria bacterium]